MNVDLRIIDLYYMTATEGILLFRQNEDAKTVLDLAEKATKSGVVTTDREILQRVISATAKSSKTPKETQDRLMGQVDSGQIVGVIVPE